MLKKTLAGLCVSAFLATSVSAQQASVPYIMEEERPEGEGVHWAVDWLEGLDTGGCLHLTKLIARSEDLRLRLRFEVDEFFLSEGLHAEDYYELDAVTTRTLEFIDNAHTVIRYNDFSSDEKAYFDLKVEENRANWAPFYQNDYKRNGITGTHFFYENCMFTWGIDPYE